MAKTPSPRRVEREMSKLDQLRAQLGEDFDVSVIESETDALEIVDDYVASIIADEALVAAGKERLKRIEARANKNRERVVRIVEDKMPPGMDLERPLYGASLGYTQKVIITDENKLDAEFFNMSPDKRKILAALNKGPVSGAELSNLTPHLILRTK